MFNKIADLFGLALTGFGLIEFFRLKFRQIFAKSEKDKSLPKKYNKDEEEEEELEPAKPKNVKSKKLS